MSGYRSLHRQQLRLQPDDENNDHDDATTAIWNVAVVEAQKGYRILTASSNGTLGIHHATEHSNASNKDLLDASAMKLDRQRPLLDGSSSQRCLGLTQVSVVRNYAGQDHAAGEFVILCLDLAGRIRLWTLSEEWVNTEMTTTSSETAPRFQFDVPNATGTTACLAPPRIMDANHTTDVVVAVGCLDGTVSILSTGIATPNAKNDPSKAGTVLDSWGSQGWAAAPLSMCWNPIQKETLAVGRHDGAIDLLSSTKTNQHRLLHMVGFPVRAIAYTPDGNLLIAGNDNGMLCIWDVNRRTPTLVHHVLHAHTSWIMDLVVLEDSRRFVTVGADKRIHVWHVGQMGQQQPVHSFLVDTTVWTMCTLESKKQDVSRLITGSETGWTYVFSLE